jgi:hypothetical protein
MQPDKARLQSTTPPIRFRDLFRQLTEDGAHLARAKAQLVHLRLSADMRSLKIAAIFTAAAILLACVAFFALVLGAVIAVAISGSRSWGGVEIGVPSFLLASACAWIALHKIAAAMRHVREAL